MRTRLMTPLTASLTVLALSMSVAGHSGPDEHDNRRQDFVGVFRAAPTALPIEDPVRCPDASHPIKMTYAGQANTSLGLATFEETHCEAPDHSSFASGDEKITFANGEMLFGTYSGLILMTPTTASDARVIIDGTYRNVGGTGTLQHAHGRGISAGVVNIMNGTATIAVSGTL